MKREGGMGGRKGRGGEERKEGGEDREGKRKEKEGWNFRIGKKDRSVWGCGLVWVAKCQQT